MVAPVKFGSEILVNTTTASDQDHSSITALKNGKFVVVWHDFNQPGSGSDTSFDAVRGQIFNADGSKAGAEFVLSGGPQTLGVQQDPVVITLSDGRFVAAWESFNHQSGDPSGSCIDARIFNEDGTPATGEFLVNTHTDFWQTKAGMAPLPNGGFVVTWMHDFQGGNLNYDIFARIYDANGNPVGSDFGVAVGAEIERNPVVTALANNKYMISWHDDGGASLNDGSGSHIGAIVYTGDTHQVFNGPQFIVNSTTANDQSAPAIATLDNGDVVIAFTHEFSGTDNDVRARVFNSTGTPLANDFAIDTNTVHEFDPAIVAMSGGQYFVSWTDNGSAGETDGSNSHVRGAIFSGINGTNVSGDFILNTSTSGAQRETAVTMLADGRIVATWTDDGQNAGDTSGSAIRAQIFDPRISPVNLNGTSHGDDWVGTQFNDSMNGLGGDDRMDGGAGADTMIGGQGNDTYFVDNAGDVVTENPNEGNDTVFASINYSLGANVENLNLTGSGSLNGNGNGLDNTITSNGASDTLFGADGTDTLIGGTGIDFMYGGLGDDVYIVHNSAAGAFENAGEGTDTVKAGVDYVLGSHVENLILLPGAINGTGNNLDNMISGNTGANTLDGGAGIDSLYGGLGNDIYIVHNAATGAFENAGEGTDTVKADVDYILGSHVEDLILLPGAINGIGNNLSNTISGNAAVNTLDGGTGVDLLYGGAGDDTYIVHNSASGAFENANEGTDTVNADVNYVLGSHVENLNLTGANAINGTGNNLDNMIGGNGAANILDGGTGEDLLFGGGGGDTLFGNSAGDQLYGSTGDDVYYVNSSVIGAFENVNEGTDWVYASANYTLGSNVENLVLTGLGDLFGNGNGLDNFIFSNGANSTLFSGGGSDTLFGGTGTDFMYGGDGNDVYYVHNTNAAVLENIGEGTDWVFADVSFSLGSQVENLVLTGSGSINGTGNGIDNLIYANGGDNILAGGGGNDQFFFSSTSGHDTITDFTATNGVGHDIIDLSGRGLTFADLDIVAAGSDTLITIAGSDTILLTGVAKALVDSTDFYL